MPISLRSIGIGQGSEYIGLYAYHEEGQDLMSLVNIFRVGLGKFDRYIYNHAQAA